MFTVMLNVPYARRNEARELGARWDGDVKKWYVRSPIAWKKCEEFLASDAPFPWHDREWRDYSFEQREQARADGCWWCPDSFAWYKATEQDRQIAAEIARQNAV
jgi:hypothetical protein